MTDPAIDQVRNDLRAITGSVATLRDAAGAGRAFELYVMTGVACALQARGYSVWVQRSDGKPRPSNRLGPALHPARRRAFRYRAGRAGTRQREFDCLSPRSPSGMGVAQRHPVPGTKRRFARD